MQIAMQETMNPLAGLISDEVYEQLCAHRLLSEKAVRDYHIRKRFRELRDAGLSAYNAIETLRTEYGYLQFDTIRKIVYCLSTRN